MENNLDIFKKKFDELKGQMVIVENAKVMRFIGLADDEYDYYYVLYDGRKIILYSCVGSIIPLKNYIKDNDYAKILYIAKLNHVDQMMLNSKLDISDDDIENYKKSLTEHWNDNTSIICGFYWELN